MSLIDLEQDDAAILKAEDEAILEAGKAPDVDHALQNLVGILNDETPPLHERTEGRDGPAG